MWFWFGFFFFSEKDFFFPCLECEGYSNKVFFIVIVLYQTDVQISLPKLTFT